MTTTLVRTITGALAATLVATPLAAQDPAAPLIGAWTAVRIGARPAMGQRPPTLRIGAGLVTANDGCNTVRGSAVVGAGTIRIGVVDGTLMACPPEMQSQATAFRGALAWAARTRLDGDRLVLLSADGMELAEFRRESGALAGTRWSVTMVNNGTGAVASLLAGTTLSLQVDERGDVSGSAGCNTYRSRLVQSGDAVRFGPAMATKRLCPAPAGVMAQEQAFLAALARSATARVDGDRLVVRDSAGATQFTAQRLQVTVESGPQVQPTGPAGRGEPMGGEFTYMADAARFRDCRTGASFPVAMEGAYRDLERAYLAAGRTKAAPLYVVLDGAVQPRPRMEGTGTEPTLVVSRYVGAWPALRCERARGTASLVNTYWRITRLAGEAIATVPGRREPHLILRERNGATEVSATVGCNGMGGRVTITGDRIEFGNLMGTMMACPEPLMTRERALGDALRRARTARVVAETLELRDETGATVALFESVYLR